MLWQLVVLNGEHRGKLLIANCKKCVQYRKYGCRDKAPREVNEKPENDYRQ